MKNLLTICLIGLVSMGYAQEAEETSATSPEARLAVDLSLASSGTSSALAVSAYRLHPIALKKKFSLGYGARFTGFYGRDNGYVTAPASVSEGNLFKVQNEAKLDTLWLKHSSVGALNIAIYLDYRISQKLSVQFNIDAIGFSFGGDRFGRFEADSEGASSNSVGASVTGFNLLLTGDYDIGSLNSELCLTYDINDQLTFRPGVSFMFAEFTTFTPQTFNNDRFRRKSLMPMLAISYRL